MSDARGHYESYALPGDVFTQVIAMPVGFVQTGEPWNEHHPLPADATKFELPAIEVVRGVPVTGRLVDIADRPLANLRVVGGTAQRRYAFATTDAQGAFTSNAVPPGVKLTYAVWMNDREPPVDATIVKEEPLLLRAPLGGAPKENGFSVSGTVVDREGGPVEGVEVTMFIEADGAAGPGGGRSMSQRQQVLTTDAGGRFHLPGPFASGARFRAIVNPGEFAIAASDARTPEGSSSLVLAPITVDRLRSIAGQVVDTAGNPVAGATVLNWGNPTPLTGAVTGTSGRFHLGSLPRTTAFLFVDAPGYRFHTSSLSSGRSTIDIVVRRDDQPPERAIATLAPPITRPEAIDLAAKVIKPYSDTMLGAGSDPEARSRVVEVLARIDPDGAWQKCQAGEAPWDSDAVRRPVAHQRATTSVADGDAIARTIKSDYWRLRTRIDLVEGVPMTDREARFKLLGEIGVDASQMENGGLRIHFLMDVARVCSTSTAAKQHGAWSTKHSPRRKHSTRPTRG